MERTVFMAGLLTLLTTAASAQSNRPNFHDGFEEGLKNWYPKEAKIEIVQDNCAEGNKCVRIERENSRGYTFIGRRFQVPSSGSLRLEAKIRAEGVTVGGKEYQRGKFVAVLI